MLSSWLIWISFIAVLAVTAIAGIYAKRSVKKASDFVNAGGTLHTGMVAGALVGGFVGGTSIVGTGEVAFRYGLSALWFTLGGGLAILLLGLCASRFRTGQVETLPAMIAVRYGEKARLGASIFLCAGMFIQVIAQILAAVPLLSVLFPVKDALLAILPALLLLAYIWFGGFLGASVVGTIKTLLLIALLIGTGGWLVDSLPAEVYREWAMTGRLSLFTDHVSSGIAQGGAMIVGIFSTQAYLQPIFASRNTKAARNGSFIAAFVIMIIGLCSAWIGLFMHEHHPELFPREAVSQFFLRYMPSWITGAALAIILLSVVMTGAALALSIGTIMNQDVIQTFTKRFSSDMAAIRLSRWLIVGVILFAYLIVCLKADSFILQWAFLSMTLRGVTVFFPVLLYLFIPHSVAKNWVVVAIWGAPILALLWAWIGQKSVGIDPFYIGMGWSMLCLIIGLTRRDEFTR